MESRTVPVAPATLAATACRPALSLSLNTWIWRPARATPFSVSWRDQRALLGNAEVRPPPLLLLLLLLLLLSLPPLLLLLLSLLSLPPLLLPPDFLGVAPPSRTNVRLQSSQAVPADPKVDAVDSPSDFAAPSRHHCCCRLRISARAAPESSSSALSAAAAAKKPSPPPASTMRGSRAIAMQLSAARSGQAAGGTTGPRAA